MNRARGVAVSVLSRRVARTLGFWLVVLLVGALMACSHPPLMAHELNRKHTMTPHPTPVSWPFFEAYRARFISEDGRVIDYDADSITTSEGQSYALFFALVSNDRPLFDLLLGWTERNLAAGDLSSQLPAWKWGQAQDGVWRVLDENSAADSDLWIAYALLEAGRLWGGEHYTRIGRRLLAMALELETVNLPGLGWMLLPAPKGFQHDGESWRLNPSYLPLQLLRAFETHGVAGPWREMADRTLRMIRDTSPHGYVADWLLYHSRDGFGPDPVKGPVGSHDAIRVYLWAGMLHPAERHRAALVKQVDGLYRHWTRNGQVPMRVDVWSGAVLEESATAGFYGVLLPRALAEPESLKELETRLESFRRGMLYGDPSKYYDQNLVLFGKGFAEGRYHFTANGLLVPRWTQVPAEPQ